VYSAASQMSLLSQVCRALAEFFRSPLARWDLRRCAHVGRSVRVLGRVWVRGRGRISIGDGVVLDASRYPIELFALEQSSEIVVGDGVQIGGGTSIEAVASVRIGARSRLGTFTKVMDNHFHSLLGDRHWRPSSDPVRIGEDVDIGVRTILLAGAEIGDRAIVRAGAVITRRAPVPPAGTAYGFPAVVKGAVAT
jgi:acetyltransferase-like isoleucine patch superfamily enzyme